MALQPLSALYVPGSEIWERSGIQYQEREALRKIRIASRSLCNEFMHYATRLMFPLDLANVIMSYVLHPNSLKARKISKIPKYMTMNELIRVPMCDKFKDCCCYCTNMCFFLSYNNIAYRRLTTYITIRKSDYVYDKIKHLDTKSLSEVSHLGMICKGLKRNVAYFIDKIKAQL